MRLGANVHANGDGGEIVAIEQAALADEGVKAEIQKLQLPEGAVVISDPWIYGTRRLAISVCNERLTGIRRRWRRR